jgi:uncharacterized protein
MKERIVFDSPLPVMLPVIKAVGNWCNLKCDYCFYYSKDQSRKTLMPSTILEKFIKEYLELFPGHVRFTWHGGEPLLAGIEFFEKIIEFQEKYRSGHQILNTVQTNGTLISDKWAQFFKDNHFRIGVSLDGNEACHGLFRKNRKGKNSFPQTIRGIKKLQKYNVPVGVLQVITSSNVNKINDNLDFFVNKLNIERIGHIFYNKNDNHLLKIDGANNDQLIEFYGSIIDFWLKKNEKDLEIREIENFIAGAMEKQASLCHFGGTCSSFFCLNYDGKIYPCDRLSDNPEFLLGDLSKQSLVKIFNSPERLKYIKRINYLTNDCLKCVWKNACHNGCFDCRKENGEYYFCQARKKTFARIKGIINNLS